MTEHVWTAKEVALIQKALAFWMPKITDDMPKEMFERIANDCWLLSFYDGPNEPDAVESGWMEIKR